MVYLRLHNNYVIYFDRFPLKLDIPEEYSLRRTYVSKVMSCRVVNCVVRTFESTPNLGWIVWAYPRIMKLVAIHIGENFQTESIEDSKARIKVFFKDSRNLKVYIL